MQPKVLKYLLDLESVIEEIESFKAMANNNFEEYKAQLVLKRAIERDLEIIGEAVKGIKTIDEGLEISSSKKIIGLRNLIIHAYDNIEDELIWGIIQKDIPKLKEDIERLKNGVRKEGDSG